MKARIGNIKKVENQKRKNAESLTYYSVIMKDESGFSNFIFTEAEMKVAYDRANRNPEDVLDRSIISYLLD
jgi:glycyl-tRNA synthetase alpha subunit